MLTFMNAGSASEGHFSHHPPGEGGGGCVSSLPQVEGATFGWGAFH